MYILSQAAAPGTNIFLQSLQLFLSATSFTTARDPVTLA